METLTEIPFSLDAATLMKQAHVEPGSDDAKELRALMDVAVEVGKPKAAYAVSFVEARNGDTVEVGGTRFASRTLARNLESTERVFPMVATFKHEMDEARPARGDMLKEFWWDRSKSEMLGAASVRERELLLAIEARRRAGFRWDDRALAMEYQQQSSLPSFLHQPSPVQLTPLRGNRTSYQH
ncbi:MAG: hypothetical protein GXY83_41920 [Rhodopirellula sp.]|nr:hypothetical protein [Rhodopirellula sp.]